MATSTVLLAAGIGAVIGWIANILISEPNAPTRERHLIDAYSQGWRACETYFSRRGERKSDDPEPAA